MPHSSETLLPPLIDPVTGEQNDFVYTPQVHKPNSLLEKVKEPKYGTWEMTDLLIKQYPPLFHAATNVPAFIRVFESIPNLEHLKISCPDADLSHRYRRDIVDFALISLRIAVERAPLPYLDAMSLVNIHPSGLLYLQPLHGLGSTPGSSKRWTQLRKLNVRMDSFPNDNSKIHTEHLKLLHVYLRAFARNLTHLSFHWNGDKGPNPLSLESEPCFSQHPASSPKFDRAAGRPPPAKIQKRAPPTSPNMFSAITFTPPPPAPPKPRLTSQKSSPAFLQPLDFPQLTHLTLENSLTSAEQISTFLSRHRRTLADLSLDDITLRTGTWDDALEPLTRMADESRRRMLAHDSMLFTPTASSIGSPDAGLRPWADEDISACNPRPMTSHLSALHPAARPHESMDVPVMLFAANSPTPRVHFDAAPPPACLRGPVIEGPLLPPTRQEMLELNKGAGSGIPLRRWFSRGRGSKARKEQATPGGQQCDSDRVGRLFKSGILGWR